MDPSFKAMMDFFTPQMNKEVMRGYVCHEVKSSNPRLKGYDFKAMEERVNATLHKAFHGLFNGRLIYGGMERCSPQEEFDFATRPKNTKRTYELAPSSIYLVRIKLSYQVEENNIQPLPDVYLHLPSPRLGGLMNLGGPLFQLIPIVSDKVISPENDYLFVRLEQYKMKFFKEINYPIVVGEDRVQHDVYWANIYKQKQGKKRALTTKANSTLVHYMLARMGFTKMFEKYAGFVPIAGNKDTINETNFPSDTWYIIRSAYDLVKPPTVIGNYYQKNEIRLAIPKEKWNEATHSLVTSFFYVTDAFADMCTPETLESTDLWKLTLGNIISDPKYTAGKIITVVEEHFSSTDTYMDDLSIEKLVEKGLHVTDFTDLLGLIAIRFKELYNDSGENQIVYGKYLDTMREMLYPITCAIYNTKYLLMKLASKPQPPNYNAVKDIFVRKFKPGPVFRLSSKGIVAEIVSYSGDHMYLKITSRLSQQESTPGTRSSKGRKSVKSLASINTSMISTGSVLFLSKKNPHPLSHINPFAKIDLTTGTFLEDPKFKEELGAVDALLKMKG